MSESRSESYKAAGVDVTAGYEAVKLMKPMVESTFTKGVMGTLGGFGGMFRPDFKGMADPILVSGTDGVGTKLKLAFLMDKHDTVGIDCVAMCVNDIACCGAQPLFFLDYIAVGKNHPNKIAQMVAGIAEGCRQVAALPDPIGEVLWMRKTPGGLNIGQKRVPMGVIGIIYEARPNVTVDAAALCFKAGSACILRGGKEAFHSSLCLTRLMRAALCAEGLPENAINLVEDTTRDSANQMMKLNGYLDVLIPRGGAGLIRSVVMNATVPVIETGTGNCHVYVDASADLDMAQRILVNAKCQRPSVCNAAESLLVHRDAAAQFLPMAAAGLARLSPPDGDPWGHCPARNR